MKGVVDGLGVHHAPLRYPTNVTNPETIVTGGAGEGAESGRYRPVATTFQADGVTRDDQEVAIGRTLTGVVVKSVPAISENG